MSKVYVVGNKVHSLFLCGKHIILLPVIHTWGGLSSCLRVSSCTYASDFWNICSNFTHLSGSDWQASSVANVTLSDIVV